MPCENDNQINVHGHIHGYATYWIPYTNQIDVAYLGGREHLVQLSQVLASQLNYSKKIKEDPKHFDEGYNIPIQTQNSTVFESVYVDEPVRIEDPFPSE